MPQESRDATETIDSIEPEAANQLRIADQAKKEPNFVPPTYVLNFLEDNEFMQRFAPNYDVEDLLVRFGRVKPPIAA